MLVTTKQSLKFPPSSPPPVDPNLSRLLNVRVHPGRSSLQEYFTLKKKLISTEYKLLRELGFVLHVEHPHARAPAVCVCMAPVTTPSYLLW